MNGPSIPDYVSPVIGCRAWDWDGQQLKSLNGEAWPFNRVLSAKCPKTVHQSPADDCSCGIYSAKSYEHLKSIYSPDCLVHGEVWLWGKVVEHDLGYRAEFAYPKSLVLPSDINPRLETSCLKSLMHYGADIYISPGILLWAKNSGYTRAGLEWVAERLQPFCDRCNKWHLPILKVLQVGDTVMLVGRGIGVVESKDESEPNAPVCVVRLGNNDEFVIPSDDMVWDCKYSRWEVELSGYKEAVITAISKGWKILCGTHQKKKQVALAPTPVRKEISTATKNSPRFYKSSSPDCCGVCGSLDVHIEWGPDINICQNCGAKETSEGWQAR
jgi:RNA polymerase subunit RPABC4/transcription elongation factor Spt4